MKLTVWWHWLRRLQFPLAMIIFATAALMPASYVTHATSDTSLHFAGNALLYFSAALAFYHRVPLAVLLIILVPYSIAVEGAQVLTQSRSWDPRDIRANMLGLIAGYAICRIVAALAVLVQRRLAVRPPG